MSKLEEDCVCRAISLALNEDYNVIQDKLMLVARLFECDKLCVCCYKYLLDNVYDLQRIEEYKGYTINEFLKYNDTGIYIIRVNGHLTTAIDNVLYDLWDCTNEIVDIVWKVN